jgi:hypothetical protein
VIAFRGLLVYDLLAIRKAWIEPHSLEEPMYAQRVSIFALLVVALAAAMPIQVGAVPSLTGTGTPTPPPSPPDAVVLYDQLNNPATNSISSQNFEAANDPFDSFLGDDFVVPAGNSWAIDVVEVAGVYFNGTGPAQSLNVWFYANGTAGGIPNVPTGAPVCTYLNQIALDTAGSFLIPLAGAPCCLSSGTYWVVVQANMSFTPNGQWGWTERTLLANATAAWQNPGGGFGACPTWNRKLVCIPTSTGPDQMFRLSGTAPCGATPVDATTWGTIKALYP